MVMVFTMIPADADPASVYSDWLGVDGSLEDSVTDSGEKIYTFGEKKSVRLSALMQQLHLSTGSLWAIRLSVSDPTAVTLREEPGLLSDDWLITAERYFDQVTLEISAFWTTRRIQLRNPKPMIPAGETVQNENGVFAAFSPVPEGTELMLAAYEPTEELRALVQERAGDEALLAWMDISLMADGEKVESAAAVTLETNIVLPEAPVINGTTGQTTLREARLFHILPDGTAEELSVEADTEDNEIVHLTFTTESFSAFALAYTVDFVYYGATFSITGGSVITMAEVFARLVISLDAAEIADVTFSDTTLVCPENTENGWQLVSLAPFTSEEVLTVMMEDGTVVVIGVRDAIITSYDDLTGYVYKVNKSGMGTLYLTDSKGEIKNSGSELTDGLNSVHNSANRFVYPEATSGYRFVNWTNYGTIYSRRPNLTNWTNATLTNTGNVIRPNQSEYNGG